MRGALVICLLAACHVNFDAVSDAGADSDATPLPPLAISKLTVCDPVTGAQLLDVTNGGTFDLGTYVDGIAVVADVSTTAGSVQFIRNGYIQIENAAPYLSDGNTTGGGFKADQSLAIGDNTITVTAFELPDLAGTRGPAKTINLKLSYTVTPAPTIVGVGFITTTNTGFIPIANGGSYSAASLPAPADIRIDASPEIVGSIIIGGTAPWNTNTENYRPYTAMGTGASFTPAPGNYTLTARGFTEGFGRGTAGAPFSISFTITP